jgi:hypothetical protein
LTELLSGMLEEPLLPVHVCVKAMSDDDVRRASFSPEVAKSYFE